MRSIENLRTFPIVTDAEKSGELTLHGAWFEVKSGELSILDRDSGKFIEP
jgi:carbonic anhydrase